MQRYTLFRNSPLNDLQINSDFSALLLTGKANTRNDFSQFLS